MKISESGLIYKLSVLFNDYDPGDFCHLCRRLVINTSFLMLLLGIGIYLTADLIASILVYLTMFTFFWTPSTVILTGIAAFIVSVTLFVLPFYLFENNPTDSESIDFIKTLYAKKKHNFCPNLDIEP